MPRRPSWEPPPPSTPRAARWKRGVTLAACAVMTVAFGAWEAVSCPDATNNPPAEFDSCTPSGTDACSSSHVIRRKVGLENRLVWKWADGTFVAFDVADHRAWFTWSYNVSTQNIRSIDKSGQGRCLTPVGSCSITYGTWRLEVCDRSGPDTCLFRRESGANVSFTYGVAFNRHLISCLGTRINWDGSHSRNSWGGDCSSGGAVTVANVRDEDLTLGRGKQAVNVGRYLSRGQLDALDHACLGRTATRGKCKSTALRLYLSLPAKVRRKVAPKACAIRPPGKAPSCA